ncbi:uncharacterized protein [Physcomitrium patens]|uniref:J domain-containing protein n=1 Tax=Physcomitrium patens TaxID=3218 RepID=A0A2K1IJU2_PHYPA|nr:auxilin-related protein 2-like isoform X1 [Physcomitrium patens]XP_024362218.1 auxilin-related protein 2-like isoform X1 [Physcomitrium patens]XP_024362219.1 auxilin-related protein 2-like isoform X1 [Physcomitrium patens]XP_024362220.1 auxilin-related protein 2-like isoform X1 [Physcomitrium patens]PNR29542.1 hypothetical protein PHYPA_028236 [Physcomitrium patens]|eukprot:XP_024362216.1 auxilin-related protein 2-like isoform X1 [Physcomitrella patens]
MEDQFANILQRNYGLKAVGKSASLGPRSEDRYAKSLDRGTSVGSGIGRINQSAAAAVFAVGDNIDTRSQGQNGSSKSSTRQSDPLSTYGSSLDEGFRMPSKSSSVGVFEEIFSGAKSGSASSSSFAEFLDGSFSKSTARSSDSPYSEDIPAVFFQSTRPTEHPIQKMNEQEAPADVGRRPSRSGHSRRSAEEEFLDSLQRDPKTNSHAGSVPSSYDSPKSQSSKYFASVECDSPLKGSFMRGFGRSRTARSTPQFSHRGGDSLFEPSSAEGASSLTGSRLNTDSNHKIGSARSSPSMDGSEAEIIGRMDSTPGFTIPASNDSAFPDLNEPYAPSSTDLPTKLPSPLRMSTSEPRAGEASLDSLDEVSKSPTSATANTKQTDSPNSGPGPFVSESRNHASAQEVSSSKDEGVPMRRAFDLNSTGSPIASSSFAHTGTRRSTRTGASRSNGPSLNIEEPLTKFEVNMPSAGGSGEPRRSRRKPDPLAEVWLTVDQIRLVTKPSPFPPPSRPPPPLPPLARHHSSSDRHRSGYTKFSETPKHQPSQPPQSSATDIHPSPKSRSSGTDRPQPSQKAQSRSDVERQPSKQPSSGMERPNGSAEKQAANQKDGFVLPEVTIVDLGSEIKPSREDRRRMREQIERERRRAKREEERLKEKERLEKEGLRDSIFRDSEPVGGREPSRPRESRREKVFDPRERYSQDPATRREEKDNQYRVLRQQEKELQDRLVKQEEARERENERSSERLRRSQEKAAMEAQERAERAAVERAVQEAHERAERAARQRAAAARDKERMKERERERERERDREEEKLRDRLREKERGLAEQLRSRDNFRATSEPRQRPTVSVNPPSGGLSRFSSGENLNNFSGTSDTRKSPSTKRAVDDWTNLFTQPSGSEKVQEIPGEPADRRKLRLEKQMLIEERAAKALQEKNMRDQALQREQEERQRYSSTLDADVRRWSVGKEGNLRALLSTLHLMLWPECNWKVVSMSDLVSGPAVKKAYQRAILCVHPDKVQQKGANVKQKYIAEKVFDLLKDAYAKFNSELY